MRAQCGKRLCVLTAAGIFIAGGSVIGVAGSASAGDSHSDSHHSRSCDNWGGWDDCGGHDGYGGYGGHGGRAGYGGGHGGR